MRIYLPYPCTPSQLIRQIREQAGIEYPYDTWSLWREKIVNMLAPRHVIDGFSVETSRELNLRYIDVTLEIPTCLLQ